MLLLDYRYHRDTIITKLPGWLRDHVCKLSTLHSTVSSIKQVCEDDNNDKLISSPITQYLIFESITIKSFITLKYDKDSMDIHFDVLFTLQQVSFYNTSQGHLHYTRVLITLLFMIVTKYKPLFSVLFVT
mgnify:CR=1 FL=1